MKNEKTVLPIKFIIILFLTFFPSLVQAQAEVTLSVEDSTSIPGSSDNSIKVSLINPDHDVLAIETLLVDENNNLICTGCIPDPVRASGFMCFAYEQDGGGCEVVMVDINASEPIEIGSGAIFDVDYIVSGSWLSGQCITVAPTDSIIADTLEDPLSVYEISGEICFITCGDVYPDESSPGANDCGDGFVNIFDVLEAIDIVLGIGVHSDCQLTRADLPNGIPPNCSDPDGMINIFDILVIVDLTLGREDCCSYYYTHMTKCATDEDCDDGNVCTDDICDTEAGECVYEDNSEPCDDGIYCTENDVCNDGECNGTPNDLLCNDANVCTDDSCDPATGCVYTNNAASCDDDIFCNGDDTCSGGSCSVHSGDPCPPDQICNENTQSCDPLCQLSITPLSAQLNPGDTVQFTAIETGMCDTPDYEWTDNLEHGEVDANGFFTAVEEVYVPEAGEVCVIDHANGDISDCASVTITEGSSGACGVAIYDLGMPGRLDVPLDCYETIQLSVNTDCINPCYEWYLDPPSTIGSTIITNPDGTALFTAGCDCSNLVEETIVVVDPCNGSISDSITVSIGSVMLDILDAIIRREDTGVPIKVSLANTSFKVKGIQVDLSDEGDYLTCTGCVPDPDRALTFDCSATEQPNGDCGVILVSLGDDLIAEGDGTIFTVTCDIKEDTPANVCFDIYPQNTKISNISGDPLFVCTSPGEICPFVCGDVYPADCLGQPNCGDGIVDVFDTLMEIDLALGIENPTECQSDHGDVPTGTLPYCSDPDGKIDIFDTLVVIDMALGKANCCDYYYLGEIY